MIPVASDALEIDLDARLLDAWELFSPDTLGSLYVMSAVLRFAYGRGYCDALVEPVRGTLLATHGYPVPARQALKPQPDPEPRGPLASPEPPEGISRCWQLGYHVYMAGPCFDTLAQAESYKASLDRQGVKWRSQP